MDGPKTAGGERSSAFSLAPRARRFGPWPDFGLLRSRPKRAGPPMRVQLFDFGKSHQRLERAAQRSARVFDHTGAQLELVYGQAGNGRARAAGGPGVARR